MRSFDVTSLRMVVVFALGLVVGGGMLSGFAPAPRPTPEVATTNSITAPCTSGDAVGDFVCRNRWMGEHSYSYR